MQFSLLWLGLLLSLMGVNPFQFNCDRSFRSGLHQASRLSQIQQRLSFFTPSSGVKPNPNARVWIQQSRRQSNIALLAGPGGAGELQRIKKKDLISKVEQESEIEEAGDIKSEEVAENLSAKEIEKKWRLVIHDDTVHLIDEVVDMINQCIPSVAPARAYEITMQVHYGGSATAAIDNKKLIDEYRSKLQQNGLTVSMAPDENFK